MQKNISFLTPLILFSILNISAADFSSLASIFGGISLSGDVQINTLYYKNFGMIAALNVDINTRTLSNSGSIKSRLANIICTKNCNITGTLSGTTACNIKAELLEGNGNIEGEKVTIICDKFKFAGTVSAKECVIYTPKPFDYSLFKRNAAGKYTVIHTKNGPQSYTYESLLNNTITTFVDNCLTLPNEDIQSELNQVNAAAFLNKINNSKILEELKKSIANKIANYKDKVEEKRGPASDWNTSAALGSLGAAGISAAAAVVKYRNILTEKYKLLNEPTPFLIAAGLTACSGYLLYDSYKHASRWLNPQFKEKHQKLSSILSRVEQALVSPQPADAQIITLQ